MRRKRIGLITICPEKEYPQRVMAGIFSQCEKYGYDVVVISPLSSICVYYQEFLHGELNILNAINFDLFDGFIITPLIMSEDGHKEMTDILYEKLATECNKPVVSIDLTLGDYPGVFTDDRNAFYHITEHLIYQHNCKNIDVLAGRRTEVLTNERIIGIKDAMEKYELKLDDSHIFQGDYWYSSGEALAVRYVNKELPLPDAVICLSDHMAIGLTNRLIKNGIKVPQQVIVTGYEAVQEASVNNPPITSYAPDQAHTGAMAVNKLMSLISSNTEIIPVDKAGANNLCIGGTCGCSEDTKYTRDRFKTKQYSVQHNYNDDSIWNQIDMSMLLESYMTELLTGARNTTECLERIYKSKYLIKPYNAFYLCLNENWVDNDCDITEGYEEYMSLAVSAEVNSKIHGWENHVFSGENKNLFPLKEMLPSFDNKFSKPQVFYFSPIHFLNISLGYAVLQNDLDNSGRLTEVYRNFLRNINNALEMNRAKYKVSYLSEHDSMTGLLNRRGMENYIRNRMSTANEKEKVFAIVVDMDGLKARNDTHGHTEGDNGLRVIADAIRSIASKDEIAVRGGGDEFYVIGIGKYSEKQVKEKLSKFNYYIETQNEELSVPVAASIGYCITSVDSPDCFQYALDKADLNMYKEKREKKAARENQ